MKISEVYYYSEDTHCFIECCGAQMSVSSYRMFRCPHCGKGYQTEFKVWEYEPGERIGFLDEPDVFERKLKEARERQRKFMGLNRG